jgi:hypothetical protein
MVRRYTEAVAHNDFDAMHTLRHPDWHEDWPQSGERIPSHEAYRKIHQDFPGGRRLSAAVIGSGPSWSHRRRREPPRLHR